MILHAPVIGLRGRYRIQVKRPDGSVRLDTGFFDNLITNSGLDQIGASTPYNVPISFLCCACFVGTGNTAPAYTDTQMTALVAQVGNYNAFMSGPTWQVSTTPYTATYSQTFSFAAGSATGTLAEVGVGYITNSSGAYLLFSHALIVDGSGNPTTITVLSNEQLDVTYQLQLVFDTTLQTGTITIGGVTYTINWYQANLSSSMGGTPQSFTPAAYTSNPALAYNGSLGGVTGSPSGTSAGTSYSYTIATYVSGNYYIDLTFSAGINDWNVSGGITALLLQGCNGLHPQWQISFSPAIPKTNLYSMTIVIRYAWARYP